MTEKPRKRKRINMRVPEDLIDFIKSYAEENGTTMTMDYVAYLDRKKEEAEKNVKPSE